MAGLDAGILFVARNSNSPNLIMPRLDPGILFAATKEDGRVKPGHDEKWV
jgi:hypothetical protein